MAYREERESNGDTAIVIDGWDKGIAPSPHKGIANMQGVNISTAPEEVACSFSRTQQSMTVSVATGSLTYIDSSHVSLSISGTNNLFKGMWISVSDSSHTGELPNGTYYVTLSAGSGFVLDTTYTGVGITGYTSGLTATISLFRSMGKPIASATETYSSGSAFFYRYYVLDANGLVWVNDSANYSIYNTSGDNVNWFLPSTSLLTNATGLAVLNGWLMVFYGNTIGCKPTVLLGTAWSAFASGVMMSPATSPNPHFAYVGHQGKCYYTDGNFIGSIFPNTSLLSGAANIQSYASYTASTTTGTISTLISGSLPTTSTASTRIPAVFFSAGTKPTAITVGTMYHISYSTSAATFEVYAAPTGGSALDIATGSSGTQYFNTFYPISAGGNATITFTPQRLNLPTYEISQSITEINNTVIIGCKGNVLYPWNQIDPLPGDLIFLPENNAVNMITVNNMAFIFAGSQGNMYITNGSTAALVISVPDYCAGIAGTQASYVEPYYTWGDAMYLRGRVYFSILDQYTSNGSSKAGNCGGIWSFIPTQNFFFGQDSGVALRMENQNSYATYSGVATVLIPNEDQAGFGSSYWNSGLGPQYWSGWYSSITSPTYGIDGSSNVPSTAAVIETDIIPTGTLLNKKTFKQVEYKLAAPLSSGETVSIKYRQNITDAFTSLGTATTEGSTGLSGYYAVNFEKGQWLQLQITLTPSSSASESFVRLSEVRIR